MNGLFPYGAGRTVAGVRASFRTLPDYSAGSIVNLMDSLIEGLGGACPSPAPLAALPPAEIAGHRQVVLIVVDGLGDAFLSRLGPETRLGACQCTRLTSVFPSTTAAAVTTFLTGLAPQQHGLTGWHMYFRELGAVLAVLPGRPRYGGMTLGQAGYDAGRFFGHRPVFDNVPVASRMVMPRQIAHSDFNLAHVGRAGLTAYDDQEGFFAALVSALTIDQNRRFVYAYWPELDRIAHEAGSQSRTAERLFRSWDAGFNRFLERVAGTDSLIIVTADHGFIDTDESHTISLEQHPELSDCLALPLCGEPRVAYCYVKPHRAQAFENYVGDRLASAAELYRSSDLIEQGWFGRGPVHPGLAERVGDYTLVMRENCVIRDWLPGEARYRQVGVHGGISSMEMLVPLAVVSV